MSAKHDVVVQLSPFTIHDPLRNLLPQNTKRPLMHLRMLAELLNSGLKAWGHFKPCGAHGTSWCAPRISIMSVALLVNG